jgi:hypothetical protein
MNAFIAAGLLTRIASDPAAISARRLRAAEFPVLPASTSVPRPPTHKMLGHPIS